MNKFHKYLYKLIIPIFYVAAAAVIVFFSWHYDKTAHQGSTPLYIDITKSPVYIKQGFNPHELVPENFDQLAEDLRAADSKWVRFHSPAPFLVMESPLEGLPQRRFMSPWGSEACEFTFLIPLEVGQEALYFMETSPDTIPGIYLAGIGDNWQIFFNGTLMYSQIHLAKDGQIIEQRSWRDVSFPVDRSLIIPGINILALRIIGDPTYGNTGLAFGSPHYMDDYHIIVKNSSNIFILILCGIFLISGIYHFALFLLLKTQRDIYYLFFSLFSLMLCIFAISRHNVINFIIPNTAISQRIEFYSYMLAVIAFGMFVETFVRGKITKVSWGYLFFILYFILTIQFFPAPQYRNDFALIVNLTNIIYYFYIFFYSVVYFYFLDKKGLRGRNLGAFAVTFITGTLLMFVSDIYEIISYFTRYSNFNFFLYSAFTVQAGMVFTLALRYRGMILSYIKLERELQQSQIAIMLSQIQPHFLYNSLTVIQDLCRTDPKMARETVVEFAKYLRGNLDSLAIKEMIPFERELHHVQTYLALEKKRFGENLNIVFDIGMEKFMLPALTLQSIVENSVRYGVTKKDEGGTVTIKTEKTDSGVSKGIVLSKRSKFSKESQSPFFESVVITVTDDGMGFNTEHDVSDNRSHIGIENVRNRLKAMCGGSLEIQSEPGVGTTVTIIIPILEVRN
ncbi:MAG: histidine kinase [Treponema sp.]|jgi:sensor histidine kinase YesM|nr:histidine kinase [Treponema sp.]